MADWGDLKHELDAWDAADLIATFWWRDDDAADVSPDLDRLLALHAAATVPLGLAVIPARATRALADRLRPLAGIDVLQHGWSHANHAPPGEKKAELGDHRPFMDVLAELREGRAMLEGLFGERVLPVVVPPWNRIGPGVEAALAGAGYAGLSTFKARGGMAPIPGLVRCNTHVDIIDWRGTRGFRGDGAVLEQALTHLAARRSGEADPDEPTGLITHHLVHDEASWRFIDRFLAATGAHPAARWIGAREAFGLA